MTPKIFIIAISSFVIGLVTGSFVYYTEFRREFEEPTQPSPQVSESVIAGAAPSEDGFSVTATAYGGCERLGCSSYRIADTGAYIYAGKESIDGILPAAALQNLELALRQAPLERQSQAVDKTNCSSFVDGGDFRYDIVFAGTSFTLDTCRTNFDNDTDLGKILLAFWQDFAELEE